MSTTSKTDPNEMSWEQAREMGLDVADAGMVADDGEREV